MDNHAYFLPHVIISTPEIIKKCLTLYSSFSDTPKNDSGVLSPASDEKEDEWQKLQALYPSVKSQDSNNSNNNADKITPNTSSASLSVSLKVV